MSSIFEAKWVCLIAAVTIWLLKGIGILWFLPGWPIVLLTCLGIWNFIVDP